MTRTAISPRLAMRTFFSTLRLSDGPFGGGGRTPPQGGYNTVTARRVCAMPGTRFTDVRRFGTMDSTNRYLLDEARAGAPEGVVAVADHQTAGRGRLGRRWLAPAGANLLVSVLLRPVLPLGRGNWPVGGGRGRRGGVGRRGRGGAGHQVAQRPSGGGRGKLAGVLAEADVARPRPGPPGGPAVVVGIGINLDWPSTRGARPRAGAGGLGHVTVPAGRSSGRQPCLSRRPAHPGAAVADLGDRGRPGPAGGRLPAAAHRGHPGKGRAGRRDAGGNGHRDHLGRAPDGGRRRPAADSRRPAMSSTSDPHLSARRVGGRPATSSIPAMRLLVTGGAGFIGSNFVRYWVGAATPRTRWSSSTP